MNYFHRLPRHHVPLEYSKMIAESALGKKYVKPVSSDKIKEAVKETLKKKIAENQVSPIYDTVNKAFEDWNKTGSKKINALRETLRQHIRDKNTFKFAETILDQLIDTYITRTLGITVKKLSRDSIEYKQFLDTTVQNTATVLDRGLTDQPMWGLFLEEKMPDGRMQEFLAVVFVHIGDYIWIPTVPAEAKLENGETLKQIDFAKMFQPIYEDLLPNKKDKGMVRITGPRGGEHLCGEVYSIKKRDDKELVKKLDLANDYKMETFVTK